MQVGGLFAPQAANMKPERINPTTGWERLWGGHGWMNLLFSCCKLTASVLAGGWVAWVHRAELLSLSQSSLDESLAVIAIVSGKIVFASVASLFILGLLDIVWQRHQWKEGLKMTRQEVMNERKEQEGNQQIRSYRRITPFSQHVRDSIEPSLVLVGKSIAVSIRWNPTTMSAPVVLAFIQGDEIQKLVAKATSLAVPVQTNDWLCARVELGCDVGHALPPSLHSEIASILRVKRSKTA